MLLVFFWGIDVFILINLADLILRYWRQNITIRVFIARFLGVDVFILINLAGLRSTCGLSFTCSGSGKDVCRVPFRSNDLVCT